jgi:hypothetical protein
MHFLHLEPLPFAIFPADGSKIAGFYWQKAMAIALPFPEVWLGERIHMQKLSAGSVGLKAEERGQRNSARDGGVKLLSKPRSRAGSRLERFLR